MLVILVAAATSDRCCASTWPSEQRRRQSRYSLPLVRPRAGIGIGQGRQFVGRGSTLKLFDLLERLHLSPQALDLLLEAHCLGLGDIIVLRAPGRSNVDRYRTMLASTCSMRLATLASVKLLS